MVSQHNTSYLTLIQYYGPSSHRSATRNYFRSEDYRFRFDVWSSSDVRSTLHQSAGDDTTYTHLTGRRRPVSGNMAEAASTNSQYTTSYSTLTRFPLTPSYLVEGYPCHKRWPRVNSSGHRSDLWQFEKYPTELASAANEESKPGCIPSAKR